MKGYDNIKILVEELRQYCSTCKTYHTNANRFGLGFDKLSWFCLLHLYCLLKNWTSFFFFFYDSLSLNRNVILCCCKAIIFSNITVNQCSNNYIDTFQFPKYSQYLQNRRMHAPSQKAFGRLFLLPALICFCTIYRVHLILLKMVIL